MRRWYKANMINKVSALHYSLIMSVAVWYTSDLQAMAELGHKESNCQV